jgi:hypothetical protein
VPPSPYDDLVRASVPTNSVKTFFPVGAVNSSSKCARTAIMGLGRDIRNLLVARSLC